MKVANHFLAFLVGATLSLSAVLAFAAPPPGAIAIAQPQAGKDSVSLYEGSGPLPCPAPFGRAVYWVQASDSLVEGCYRIVGGNVQVAFVDGDRGEIPMSLFVITAGKKLVHIRA